MNSPQIEIESEIVMDLPEGTFAAPTTAEQMHSCYKLIELTLQRVMSDGRPAHELLNNTTFVGEILATHLLEEAGVDTTGKVVRMNMAGPEHMGGI